MSIGDITQLVRAAAVPPYSALLLFGSFARGDQDDSSDIDVVQVTPVRTKSYSRGRVNITCYTTDQLGEMAVAGSLFVKHLVLEAVPLADPEGFLDTLRAEYVEPETYQGVFDGVICSLPVVAILRAEFQKFPHQYSTTAGYLLRTYVYARAFTEGVRSFSMKEIATRLGDPRPFTFLRALRSLDDYARFRQVVDLLFDLTHQRPFIRTESLEALVVNSSASCRLATTLGLRILAQGELIEYDVAETPIV